MTPLPSGDRVNDANQDAEHCSAWTDEGGPYTSEARPRQFLLRNKRSYLPGATAGGWALAEDLSISARPFLARSISSGCLARLRNSCMCSEAAR